jgi:hypothetical protein
MIDGEQYGKDLRSMFVPNRGYSLVEHDLSQAEARMDAVLASDHDILSGFDDGIGIHCLTGSWVYDCKPVVPSVLRISIWRSRTSDKSHWNVGSGPAFNVSIVYPPVEA